MSDEPLERARPDEPDCVVTRAARFCWSTFADDFGWDPDTAWRVYEESDGAYGSDLERMALLSFALELAVAGGNQSLSGIPADAAAVASSSPRNRPP